MYIVPEPCLLSSSAWIAYLNIGILLGTLALALFNASEDAIARDFAYVYAGISVCVVVRSNIHLSLPSHPEAEICTE